MVKVIGQEKGGRGLREEFTLSNCNEINVFILSHSRTFGVI